MTSPRWKHYGLATAIGVSRRRFQAGECDAARVRSAMADVLARGPRARTDYVSAADPLTLRELERVEAGALVSLAVRIGSTRLIDNVLL